jgi:hypothetical protein
MKIENRPTAGTTSAWAVLFYPLKQPIELALGDRLTVCGAHDRLSLRIWVEVPEV